MALPPLVQRVEIDLATANRQIDALERQLATLNDPVHIPVEVETDQALDKLRRDVAAVDNQTIDVDVDVDGVNRAETEFSQLNRELGQTDSELEQVSSSARRAGNELDDVGRRGSTAFSGLSASAVGLVGALAAFQGFRILGRGLGAAIEDASNLEESLSKTNVVFGDLTGEIQEFASTAPQALGLSSAAALEATSTFGNLFVALGLTQEAAADMAPDIVQLAADLASFNNIEVGEAVEKLRAGLVGEAEPLRVLGVNINAALVEAKALELGLGDVTGEVSEAAKVQARYALILEQTVTAQGDYERTADGIANTQRTLSASFEELSAKIGTALAPALESLLSIMPSLVAAIETTLVPALAGFGTALGNVDTEGFVANIATLPGSIGQLTTQASTAGQSLGNALQVFNAIATLNFGDVGTQFSQLGEDIDSFQDAGIANTAVQNLIETLSGGAAPIAALEGTLATLGESVGSMTLEGFGELAEQLVDTAVAAGATGPELKELAGFVKKFGVEAGFSEAGVALLVDLLEGPLREALAAGADEGLERFARGLVVTKEAAIDAVPPISDAAEEILALSLAGKSLEDFFPDLGAEGIIEPIDAMVGALDAAKEAMRDDEGEIVADLETFFDNLNSGLADRLDFTQNLAILRARGQDLVADVFEGLGPEEGATFLADAVDNPQSAAEEEQRLRNHATAMAQAEFSAFDVEVKQLISGYDSLPPIEIPIISDWTGFTLEPPGGRLPNGPVGDPAPRQDQRTGGDTGRGGDLNLTFVNNTTNDLLTDAQRAAQVISGVVRTVP
jgi:hypothetical protein